MTKIIKSCHCKFVGTDVVRIVETYKINLLVLTFETIFFTSVKEAVITAKDSRVTFNGG